MVLPSDGRYGDGEHTYSGLALTSLPKVHVINTCSPKVLLGCGRNLSSGASQGLRWSVCL